MSILALATILLWIAVFYELNKPSEKQKERKIVVLIILGSLSTLVNDLSYSKAFCLKIFLVTGVASSTRIEEANNNDLYGSREFSSTRIREARLIGFPLNLVFFNI